MRVPLKKLLYTTVILISFLFISCSKDDDVTSSPDTSTDISLSIDSQTLLINYSITYSAVATGNGKLTEITYLDETGTIKTVANPTLPWSKTLSFSQGQNVSLSAKGTLAKGSITINVDGVNGSNTIHFTKSETKS
jgi:hypothetical protein